MNNEFDDLVLTGRRSLIQAANLTITFLTGGLASLKLIILGFDSPPIPALFMLIVGLLNAVYINRNGSIDVAAWTLVVTLLLGLTSAGVYTGGLDSPVVLLAPIIPIMTVLLINLKAAYITLGSVCLILTCVFILGANGYISGNSTDPNLVLFGRYIVLTCLCLISTWVVSRFASLSRTLLVKLDKQSNIDHLTGILNRRAIETRLLQEVGRAKRANTWLSFIMADVDLFKLYNDSNGHPAGDTCLKSIATLINGCCERPTDIVGRFGGEEFVLILPDTNNEGALMIAENLQKALLDKDIPYGPKNTNPVSLTLGIVSARGNGIDSVEKLTKEADVALYEGKDQGRNCLVSKVFSGLDE